MILLLGSLLLAMSVIALGAAALSRALAKASAAARHGIWLGAMAAVTITPLIWLTLGGLWSVPIHADSISLNTGPASRLTNVLVVGVWALGVALATSAVVTGATRARRNSRLPTNDSAWWHESASVAEQARQLLGIKRPVLLRCSSAELTPVTWGIRRPVIVLPAAAHAWSVSRRWAVLLHEMSHVRRLDYLVELFLIFSTIVYWFHPTVWWLAHHVRDEREKACDDLVVRAGVSPVDYADHLVEIARAAIRERRVVIVGLGMARPSAIAGRVARVLGAPVRPPRRYAPGAVLVSTFLVASLVGAATPLARPITPRQVKAKCDCAAKLRARALAKAAHTGR